MIVIRIVVGVILYALFFGMCYMATGTDKKNIGGFQSYPDEVQKRVYQDETLGKLAPKKGLNLFDLIIIDLLWWRNSERIRFSCVPEKEAYQNPKKHVDSFMRGIPTFALVAVLTGLIIMLIG